MPLVAVPDEDQPVGVRIRQRPEQRLVEQAEDRGVGADAQRERQDGDEREDRLLAERPEGEAEVLHGRLDGTGAGQRLAKRDYLLNQIENLGDRVAALVVGVPLPALAPG